MKSGQFINKLFTLFILMTIPVQAQVNGSSGGGGPSRDDIKAICTEWLDKVSTLEKAFVEKRGGIYKTQKDFFKQMEIIIGLEMGKVIMKINSSDQGCVAGKNTSEIALLKEIKEIWQSAFITEKKCLGMFSQRYHHRAELDSLINIYCWKNGEQTKNPHEGK